MLYHMVVTATTNSEGNKVEDNTPANISQDTLISGVVAGIVNGARG